jgi:hypothetical protein
VSTCREDRKASLRHLIERVLVAVRGDSEYVDLTIVWAGDGTSRHELVRPVRNFEQLRDHERLLGRIVELRRSGLTARRIAERLNTEGRNSCGGRSRFTKDVVICLRRRFGLVGNCRRSRGAATVLEPGEWWAADLARHLGMDRKTLGKWILRGWVAAPAGRRCRLVLDCPGRAPGTGSDAAAPPLVEAAPPAIAAPRT